MGQHHECLVAASRYPCRIQTLCPCDRGCDPVEAELAKERQENLFDQIVFAAGIEERREVVPTLNLCWR